MHKKMRQRLRKEPPAQKSVPLPPEVEALKDLYFRLGDRVGVISQMLRFSGYCHTSGVFATFLRSKEGYDERVSDDIVKEEWADFCLGTMQHAVVMLHATTEDVVRSLARMRLPNGSADALKDVPFNSDPKLKDLSQLVPHRAMSVADLIRSSVDSWLDREPFSNSGSVVNMLKRIGLTLEGVRPYFATIDAVAKLRHEIAHTGSLEFERLDALLPNLDRYIGEVYLFARTCLLSAVPKEYENHLKLCMAIVEEENRRKGLKVLSVVSDVPAA